MKVEQFEKESRDVLEHCWGLLFSKAKEYASDEDRLWNFRQPTSMMGTNPANVCLWYDMKHIGSLSEIARKVDMGVVPSREMLKEKVGDYLNYGLLFYACMIEQIEKAEANQNK